MTAYRTEALMVRVDGDDAPRIDVGNARARMIARNINAGMAPLRSAREDSGDRDEPDSSDPRSARQKMIERNQQAGIQPLRPGVR